PNRAVKPLCADGTTLETVWESRSPPIFIKAPRVIPGGFVVSARFLPPFLSRSTMPEMTMMPLPDGPHLLDGPTGTELERRGFHLPPPLWSAAAIDQVPELLESIHRDYIHAGATVITANTFRTNPATFALVDRSTWD